MSDDGSGEKGVRNPVPSTNTKQSPQSSDEDIIHSHNSGHDCKSPSDESYMGCSSCPLSPSLPSGGSAVGNIQKTSESSRMDLKEHEQTPPNTEMKQNLVCSTKSKVGSKGFWWRKSFPWKSLYSKSQQATKAENDIIERVSSAQLHKIKALSSELQHVQRMLEEATSENRLLTRLQHRHTKALQEYESPESTVHRLVSRHDSEVRALKEMLKSSQERERYLSKKLREAESELLRTKDQLQKLQKLSEDRNLAEREELRDKLAELLMKVEIDEKKVKALERQHQLTVSFYDRQLYLEHKKLSDARDTTGKLQEEILSLQKKIKEKDRELDIKNIYANRMPRDLYKYESLFGKRGSLVSSHNLCNLEKHTGLTLTKSTQTVSDVLEEDQQNTSVTKERADLQDRSNEYETNKGREEENNSHSERTSEDTPTHEVQQTEESYFLESDSGKTEQFCENEKLEEELDKLLGRVQLESTLQRENSWHDEMFHENKFETGERGESSHTIQTRSFVPRLRRNYKFTVATENLHQGFPATGPLSNLSSVGRNRMLPGDLSLGYEPSFSNNKARKRNDIKDEKTEKSEEISQHDKKNMLMEELFGTGSCFKN